MTPEQLALQKVIEKCESIIRLENRPDDNEIALAEEIINIIVQQLNK